MPVNTDAMITALTIISEEENLRVCVSESLKGGAITGLSTVCGGLLLGPVGLAVGGIIGGICAAISSNGKFKPVAVVIREMPLEKQEDLAEHLRSTLRDVNVLDVAMFLSLLASDPNLKQLVVKQLVSYLRNNMGMRIASF